MNSRNIRLLIAYDGSGYAGWQRQRSQPTIQGKIENALEEMTATQISLHGAGRTDAGVHACGMVANFQTVSRIPVKAFSRGLNSMLPADIRLLASSEIHPGFHSRYNATGKTYCYFLYTGAVQLPTRRLYQAHAPGPFDIEQVQNSLTVLTGTQDFASFEGAGSRDKQKQGGRGAVRTLYSAQCRPGIEKNSWEFTFTGDGFLRHMVRNLMGTLILAGGGKLDAQGIKNILQGCDRALAGPTAQARGLFLKKVHYSKMKAT